jgi:predicted amidophosphoribosyltransferase
VAGAFAARAEAPPCVWLVDDVVTTGSTLSEAARALRRAGSREVVGVCLARRPLVG